MRVAVIGTGYVGLVAGVCFADAGHDVACVDTDASKVEALRRGEVPIYEPGLHSMLERVLRDGRIAFTTVHAEAVAGADVVFIGVGTPEGLGGVPDMQYVEAAVKDVLAGLTGPTVLVMKSTVPVGTAQLVRQWVKEHSAHPIDVVSNPEFLKEGAAVDDFLRPDRVVIGTDSDAAWETMQGLYRPFVLSGRPILRMSNESAELTKYASNAMLATRVSFMNEIAGLCDRVGADVHHVARGMGSDARIGRHFLYAGCGYGGSCFPKDTQGLMHVAQDAGTSMKIVEAAEAVNDAQKLLLAERVVAHFGEDLSDKRFALWGLSFKPKTDDIREAPAAEIATALLGRGATLVGCDPEAIDNFRGRFGDRMGYHTDPYEAAKDCDAVILCTEWERFRNVDWERLKDAMRHPVIYDGRNVLDPAEAAAAGFGYEAIGRNHRLPDRAAAADEPSPPQAVSS